MTSAAPTAIPVHALKGGDVLPGVGEVFDTAPHADARFTLVRAIDARGNLVSLAMLSDVVVELD